MSTIILFLFCINVVAPVIKIGLISATTCIAASASANSEVFVIMPKSMTADFTQQVNQCPCQFGFFAQGELLSVLTSGNSDCETLIPIPTGTVESVRKTSVVLDAHNGTQRFVRVTYRTLGGRLASFQQPLSEISAASLMLGIQHKEGIPPAQQRITHRGKDLLEVDFAALFHDDENHYLQTSKSKEGLLYLPSFSACCTLTKDLELSLALRVRGGMWSSQKRVRCKTLFFFVFAFMVQS